MKIMAEQTMITQTCCNCHVLFAIPEEMNTARKKDKKSFYCPNGHSQSYIGQPYEKKLEARVEELKKSVDDHEKSRAYWEEQAEDRSRRGREGITAVKRQLANARGQLTRLKNKYEPKEEPDAE
jgi:DNA repair exonuclease SbcCD ATPase subunit